MTELTDAQKRAIQRARTQSSADPRQRAIQNARSRVQQSRDGLDRIGGLRENLIGDDIADTPGERAGRMIGATGAGAARGAEALVNLPSQIGNAANEYIVEPVVNRIMTATGAATPEQVAQIAEGRDTQFPVAEAPGAVTDFAPQNVAEQYAGTAGEFLAGAPLGPGGVARGALGRNALTYGAVPGVASEAAGQATAGTPFEPYARMSAALAAPAMVPGLLRRAPISRTPVSAEEGRVELGEYLRSRGVDTTVGQSTGNATLQRMEGTMSPSGEQFEAFTRAALESIGSSARRATPEAMADAQKRIVTAMDDAIDGVSVTVQPALATDAADIAVRYTERVPAGSLTPRIRGIADEIADAATSPTPQPISLAQIREWRSDIGKLTTSPDGATREAAHSLRGILDAATDRALRAAGREDDLARLAQARTEYRDFLAIRDAATRAGAEGGMISPTQLNQSVIRTQGRANYGVGNTTDLANLSRAGASVLRQVPTVSAGGIRNIAGAMQGVGGASGAAIAAGAGMGVPGMIMGGLAGAAAPMVGQAITRGRAAQNALGDPSSAIRGAFPMYPGFTAD